MDLLKSQVTKIAKVIPDLEDLPEPVLVHCGAGARAGGIALIATAIQEGLTLKDLTAKTKELGVSLAQLHFKQFIAEQYTPDEQLE